MTGKFNCLIDHLIFEKIFEIVLLLILLTVSMLVWGSFNIRVSASNITTLEDYKMNFTINKTNDGDIIIVENPYYFSKIYSIFLVFNESVNLKKTAISINNEKYILDDLSCVKAKGKWHCSIINDELTSNNKIYRINLKFSKKISEYDYIFGESNNFSIK